MAAGPPPAGRADARRNALLLAGSQAIVGSCAPICISMGGLAGAYLLAADKSLATLPVTGFNVGVAFGAMLAAALMRRVGRRMGFLLGALLPAAGGALAAAALFAGSFWLFAAGLLVVGLGNAFVQQYRFAAADAAPAAFKPQAISLVLAGGVFAAVIGPQTVIHTRDAFAPVMFAGTFAALIPLALVGMAVLSQLRIPNDTQPTAKVAAAEPARRLGGIVLTRRFLTGLVCGVSSYALMTFMMTGAPLAMVGCGIATDTAMLGIQWHVMAMFAPSFVTGRIIARFGSERVIATGLIMLAGSALVAHLGIAVWNFWTALILLGLGWNFGFIGATAMVASSYRASERSKAQAVNDGVLFTTVALASFASGKVLNAWGWNGLNLVFWPILLACLMLLASGAIRRPLAAR